MFSTRRSHRPLSLAATLLVVLTAACGDAPEAGSAGDGEADPSFRAALLTSGPVSDAGWYAGAYEGLLLIRDSLGAEVRHQQTRTPSEFDEAFLSFGQAGYDLVFAHGNEYQDAAIRAGELFPEMTIVVSGGGRFSDNVVPLVFNLEEASYLAGMIAGGVTGTGTVGMVGGVAIPPAQGTFLGFEAGAKAVRPDVRVLETFIGNWNDVAAAKEATVAQLRQGADVIIHNTDAASFGVFQAVREAVEAGDRVWALGMNRDQNDVAPEVILGSAAIDIPSAFLTVGRRWQAGELRGAPIFAGAREGVVDLILNPTLEDRIPAELRARVEAARDSVVAGTLDVPRVPFVEGQDPNGIEVVGSR
ncbi:MAG: BMP family protein [Gemmatimonadota bacterium]|jgi:basic membrane protein A